MRIEDISNGDYITVVGYVKRPDLLVSQQKRRRGSPRQEAPEFFQHEEAGTLMRAVGIRPPYVFVEFVLEPDSQFGAIALDTRQLHIIPVSVEDAAQIVEDAQAAARMRRLGEGLIGE